MAAIAAERDLLFGLLALQSGLINQVQLVAAFQAWTLDKARALADHLVVRGDLDADDRAAVEVLLARHIKKHGGDVERSLAAIPAGRPTRESLARIDDPDVGGTLAHLGSASTQNGDHADRTASYAVGEATSAGQRFRVLRPHARGGLGAVFVALDDELHREVALKQILEKHADDLVSRQRFVAEAEITGGLEHPGVVPVYGLGTDAAGRPYYAMRFIKGNSLKEAIARFHEDEGLKADASHRSLELRRLLRNFTDVCNAIDYAHSRGVIHRDLKPANIIVGKHGETLVVDWGLAKSVAHADPSAGEQTLAPSSGGSSETLPGSALGTPAYMSPEQARGDLDRHGPRSDVYSLGATLYCLLTGKPPFDGDDIGVVLRAVQEGQFPRPSLRDPTLDKALEAVCLKAMAREPEHRYKTPKALADDLDRWMADEPVSAWREPISLRLRRWSRRHRLIVTALGATLVVAVAALAAGNVLVAHQRDRAQQNLAFARTVVDEMYTQVALELERSELALPEQRMILEKALRFYERFAVPQSRHPEILFEAAQAGLRLGKIQRWLREYRMAAKASSDALTILSRLAIDHPGNSDYRLALAQAHSDLGESLFSLTRRDEGGEELTKAAEIYAALAQADTTPARGYTGLVEVFTRYLKTSPYERDSIEAKRRQDDKHSIEVRRKLEALINAQLPGLERWAREHPEDVRFQEGLDLQRYWLSDHKLFSVDARDVEQGLIRRIRRSEDIIRERPGSADARFSLAMALSRLGTFSHIRSDPDFRRALEQHNRSIAILEKLSSERPEVPQYARALAHNYAHKAIDLSMLGKNSESQELEVRIIDQLRLAHRLEPMDREALKDFEGHLGNLSEILNHQGRYREALPFLEEAVALEHAMYSDAYRLLHALTAARLGDLSHLQRHVALIRTTLDDRVGSENAARTGYWITHFDAACVHAALAKLERAGQTATPERRRIALADYELALEHLEKARAAGDFKGITSLDEVRRDPTLDILRSDPRFQRLMMDLAFPDNPFRAESGPP